MGCFVRGGKNGMGCYVLGDKNSMGCYVRGDKNSMGCFVRGGKSLWDVLSGVANLCGMFCPGWQKMAWDVLSRDVLSGSPLTQLLGRFCSLLTGFLIPTKTAEKTAVCFCIAGMA